MRSLLANRGRGRRAACALAASLLMVAAVAAQAPRRLVFVLAGQSHIEYLARANPCVPQIAPRANVTYWDWHGGLLPQPTAGRTAMTVFGDALGAAMPRDRVDVVLLAVGASALFRRNDAGPGYWLDPADLGDPAAFMNMMWRAGDALATDPTPIDALHIVWGQGETDISPFVAQPASSFEYWFWAQGLFSSMARQIGRNAPYSVHLVTPGSVLADLQPRATIDALRDAYVMLGRVRLPFYGFTSSIDFVAHAYDLPHDDSAGFVDAYHLDHCGYAVLAGRIADGLVAPAEQPRVAGDLVFASPTDVAIQLNVPLLAMPFTQKANGLFEVVYGTRTLAPEEFEVAVLDSVLIVRGPAVLTAATPVFVRYVAGTGYRADWVHTALRTKSGRPLAPFVLAR